MQVHAPAKLNLLLHVVGKRIDGYHLLESFVACTQFGDTLTFEEADTLSLHITGQYAPALAGEADNLVLEAGRLLQQISGYRGGARMTLGKNIPVGAGLGGGSSDAAAAIKGLSKLWRLSVDDNDIGNLALRMGADVPVCLTGKPAWITGIGEVVIPLHIHVPIWTLLVNPGVPLLTKDVFSRFGGAFNASMPMPQEIYSFDVLVSAIASHKNDLQAAAIELNPTIAEIIDALKAQSGCGIARMSGSGATCFGLFVDEASALAARANISAIQPGWWSVVTKI